MLKNATIFALGAVFFPNLRYASGTYLHSWEKSGGPGGVLRLGNGCEEFFNALGDRSDLEWFVENCVNMGSDGLIHGHVFRAVHVQKNDGEMLIEALQAVQAFNELLRGDGVDHDQVGRMIGHELVEHTDIGRRNHIVPVLKQHRQAEAEIQVRTIDEDGLLLLTRFDTRGGLGDTPC
jgi:hypothetical protein